VESSVPHAEPRCLIKFLVQLQGGLLHLPKFLLHVYTYQTFSGLLHPTEASSLLHLPDFLRGCYPYIHLALFWVTTPTRHSSVITPTRRLSGLPHQQTPPRLLHPPDFPLAYYTYPSTRYCNRKCH
jgi:hypothetical protein